MKLVIDSKIPFMRGYAERLGEVTYLEGAAISAADVREADALIVRTRTRCDRQLLEGSRVRFIATATIGYDHLDTHYLAEAGIRWTNCPGCNATSVAQYVQNTLLLLAAHGCWQRGIELSLPQEAPDGLSLATFAPLTLGIVGVGHVGSKVYEMARRLGFGRILLCDPPRREAEQHPERFCSLAEIAETCDVVTFHTPLTHREAGAPHPTYHLADSAFFAALRPGAVVINTCRGEVVDTVALLAALESGRLRAAVIDTWENEPHIDRRLLTAAWLATPHIAGYSADGKANGTRMSLQTVARFFGLDPSPFELVCPPSLPAGYAYYPEGTAWRLSPALRLYDPTRDSLALKARPDTFEYLRGNYPLRRERF